jgi:hypothetical protein
MGDSEIYLLPSFLYKKRSRSMGKKIKWYILEGVYSCIYFIVFFGDIILLR